MNGPDNLLPSPIEAANVPEVRNHTRYPSQYFQMIDVADTLFHVIVTRITYDLSTLDGEGYPAETKLQSPLCETDEHYGAPNESSVIQESDYAPFKPKCDVLIVNTSAHAPAAANGERKAMQRFPAGLRITFDNSASNHWQKLLTVTGPRTLKAGLLGGFTLSEPEPTLSVPLRYEHALGGTNLWWKGWPQLADDDQRMEIDVHDVYNPIGCGVIDPAWQKQTQAHHKNQYPAPQIEAFDEPFTASHAEAAAAKTGAANPDEATPIYPAIGLGPIGRWWLPRRKKAGSYDEIWKATRWPKLPKDFDFGYWNAAPEDQQIDYPSGGEHVTLINLHATHSELRFRLPRSDLQVRSRMNSGVRSVEASKVDGIMIDMDALTLTIVHRSTVPSGADVRVLEIGVGDGETQRWETAKPQPERSKGAARG
jgi:hypothetical protein